jgi:hypothetical protein
MTTATVPTARSRPDPSVYLFKAGTSYKIGVTTDVGKRRKQVQSQCADPLEIIHVITDGDAKQIERQLHETFHHRWLHGEWFELSPQDVARIKAGQFMPPLPPAASPAPPANPRPSTTPAAATPPRPATGEHPPRPQPAPARSLTAPLTRSLTAIGWTACVLLLGAGLFVGSAYYEKSTQWQVQGDPSVPVRPAATVAVPTPVPPPPAARPVQAPPVAQPVIAPPPAAPAPAPAAPVVPAPAPAAPAVAPPAPTAASTPPATEGGGRAAGAGRWMTRMGATATAGP